MAMISQETLRHLVKFRHSFTQSERDDVIDEIASYQFYIVDELERLSDRKLASILIRERNSHWMMQDFYYSQGKELYK